MATDFDLQEGQAEVIDIADDLKLVASALSNAESCETLADFDDNLTDALNTLEAMQRNVKELRAQVREAKKEAKR